MTTVNWLPLCLTMQDLPLRPRSNRQRIFYGIKVSFPRISKTLKICSFALSARIEDLQGPNNHCNSNWPNCDTPPSYPLSLTMMKPHGYSHGSSPSSLDARTEHDCYYWRSIRRTLTVGVVLDPATHGYTLVR